jgi:ribosomal protein L12E/L44/L45/RPP1/RPP2
VESSAIRGRSALLGSSWDGIDEEEEEEEEEEEAGIEGGGALFSAHLRI